LSSSTIKTLFIIPDQPFVIPDQPFVIPDQPFVIPDAIGDPCSLGFPRARE
jgi:hypothetical protein